MLELSGVLDADDTDEALWHQHLLGTFFINYFLMIVDWGGKGQGLQEDG